MATQLEKLGEQYRNELLSRNGYNGLNGYSSTNRNALSDGDEKGKGENSGNIGSKTDINVRIESITRNKYGENKRYPDF